MYLSEQNQKAPKRLKETVFVEKRKHAINWNSSCLLTFPTRSLARGHGRIQTLPVQLQQLQPFAIGGRLDTALHLNNSPPPIVKEKESEENVIYNDQSLKNIKWG